VSIPVRLLLEAEAAQIAASSITAGELAHSRPDPARLARSEVAGKAGHRRRQPEIPLYHLHGGSRMPLLISIIESLWLRSGPTLHHLPIEMSKVEIVAQHARVLAPCTRATRGRRQTRWSRM
jgi:DNA-binding GntR family transcriptional regulator